MAGAHRKSRACVVVYVCVKKRNEITVCVSVRGGGDVDDAKRHVHRVCVTTQLGRAPGSRLLLRCLDTRFRDACTHVIGPPRVPFTLVTPVAGSQAPSRPSIRSYSPPPSVPPYYAATTLTPQSNNPLTPMTSARTPPTPDPGGLHVCGRPRRRWRAGRHTPGLERGEVLGAAAVGCHEPVRAQVGRGQGRAAPRGVCIALWDLWPPVRWHAVPCAVCRVPVASRQHAPMSTERTFLVHMGEANTHGVLRAGRAPLCVPQRGQAPIRPSPTSAAMPRDLQTSPPTHTHTRTHTRTGSTT